MFFAVALLALLAIRCGARGCSCCGLGGSCLKLVPWKVVCHVSRLFCCCKCMCKIWREGLVVCPTTLSDMIGSTVYPSLVHAQEISLCFLGHVSECFGRATGPSLGCFPGSLGSRLSCLRCPFPLAATLLLAAFACLLVLGMAFLLGRLLRCLAGWFLYPGPRWCSPCRFVLSARVCCCRRGWRKRHHVRCEPPAFQPRRKQRTYMTLNTQLAVRKPALNQSLRGGGSPSEADLLTSLQTLLQSFAGDNKQTGSHKGSPQGFSS